MSRYLHGTDEIIGIAAPNFANITALSTQLSQPAKMTYSPTSSGTRAAPPPPSGPRTISTTPRSAPPPSAIQTARPVDPTNSSAKGVTVSSPTGSAANAPGNFKATMEMPAASDMMARVNAIATGQPLPDPSSMAPSDPAPTQPTQPTQPTTTAPLSPSPTPGPTMFSASVSAPSSGGGGDGGGGGGGGDPFGDGGGGDVEAEPEPQYDPEPPPPQMFAAKKQIQLPKDVAPAAPAPAPSFLSQIPPWGWAIGGAAAIYILMTRKAR